MKIIFAGTPDFALSPLQTLVNSKHHVCAVYTQPDRPAGRGQKLTASPVKKWALEQNIPLYQPISLKEPNIQKELQNLNADILVNVAYGLLLPQPVLNIPRFGCINIHPSLLPRWRGASPIQRAIISGDKLTGVTIMQMDIGLDTGAIYKQLTLPITDTDTTATMMQKTSDLGAKLLLEVLDTIENGTAKTTQQDDTQSTYAHKISKEEGKIDWAKNAKEIELTIRAFNPWPIAYTEINGTYLRIWQAKLSDANGENVPPGTIVQIDKNGIQVTTGNGVLCLLKVQLPGGKPLTINDLLHAQRKIVTVGEKFSS